MKPRRMSRHRRDRDFARRLQLYRLRRIARGERDPLCEREAMYLETLRRFGRANPADFVLPYPLLVIEALALEPPEDAAEAQ